MERKGWIDSLNDWLQLLYFGDKMAAYFVAITGIVFVSFLIPVFSPIGGLIALYPMPGAFILGSIISMTMTQLVFNTVLISIGLIAHFYAAYAIADDHGDNNPSAVLQWTFMLFVTGAIGVLAYWLFRAITPRITTWYNQ